MYVTELPHTLIAVVTCRESMTCSIVQTRSNETTVSQAHHRFLSLHWHSLTHSQWRDGQDSLEDCHL